MRDYVNLFIYWLFRHESPMNRGEPRHIRRSYSFRQREKIIIKCIEITLMGTYFLCRVKSYE
jgi:hypothetical protein